MTANEMKSKVQLGLDEITNFSTPGLLDEEYASILSDAELEFVKSHSTGNPTGNIDYNEVSRRNLHTLYRIKDTNTKSNPQGNLLNNGQNWDLPSDLLFTILERAVVSSSHDCIDGSEIKVVPKTYDQYGEQIKNPYRNPSKEVIWRLQMDNKHQLILPESISDVTKYIIGYIKYPEGIVPYKPTAEGGDGTTQSLKNSLLPDHTHTEIVRMAINQALAYLSLRGSVAQTEGQQ